MTFNLCLKNSEIKRDIEIILKLISVRAETP